ncbi:hypothetical protein KMZ30_07305 [Phycicoccus sp. KQZ13P-1]|uniref:hypothetical protein n=1 Tax=Phycicoccus mangrovi TaxID=2840470 RepID=UPI001BFFFEC1|nr:hypothetical protein [Phycicoccus mangrovi]MBT9255378.1 hypothetical protein [Phycicoccus mangrovi]
MATTDLLTLDDARRACLIPDGVTDRDSDLAGTYVPAVTDVVEDVVGPVVARTFTRTELGGGEAVVLPHVGVSAVSVTVAGAAVASTGFVVDEAAGIVWASSGAFGGTTDEVVVTYTAGVATSTADVPAPIRLAARMILAWMWRRDVNGRPDQASGDKTTSKTPSGYDIPQAALSLLRPSAAGRAPGFA